MNNDWVGAERASERHLTTLWDEIDTFLARARATRPLHHASALLDLDRLTACGGIVPHVPRLAEALDGWDGHLLLGVSADLPTLGVRPGDSLVIDPAATPADGDMVAAFIGGALLVRRLEMRAGCQWLVAGPDDALPLGPEVAILGVVVELRRALRAAC